MRSPSQQERHRKPKDLFWVGSSRDDVREFPDEARKELGHNLDLVQNGQHPADWKPMKTIGAGVLELRVHNPDAYRVFYIATFPEGVYVLHAFNKKTAKTSEQDKRIGRKRYKDLVQWRRDKGMDT